VRQLSDQFLSNDQIKDALRLTPDGADYIRIMAMSFRITSDAKEWEEVESRPAL
jgi:hypothetical protein